MNEEVLIDPCPICQQSALAGDNRVYTCSSCGAKVEQSRWLGLWTRNQFLFRTIGADYRNVEYDLTRRGFSQAQLAQLAGSCYTDADLEAMAAGDLSHLRLPASTVAQVMFSQTRETCYVQLNGLIRAEGPPLAEGVERVHHPADRTALKILDRGNLFISEQRLVFPSNTHTVIRLDRKLTGLCAYSNAIGLQRKGDNTATYFLGLESRDALLATAYLQGRLDHLR